MNLQCETSDINEYLAASEVIDFYDNNIQAIAKELSEQANTEVELAKIVYEFVRDNISHSFDIDGKAITCQASSVLRHKEGICFAKSHLLAAILRDLGIPIGFCYQRLILNDSDPTKLTLHGLNAIYLSRLNRWVRVDARGNKKEVNAEFCLEGEMLAFQVRTYLSEIDYPTIYAQPHNRVISALKNSNNFEELIGNLPDEISREN
ncbi:MAG: transglutaminase-like domain-containing protein [Aphanothece sp. CMT-3BRIN-NPC111]|nr:transglutaminase-like domain-containing protein [Aphanothece sp. CMT-3BRIN-NPC111]